MSAHVDSDEHFAGSTRLFISIWIWLLLLTGFEVFLGYIRLPVIYMLVILMGASIIKAALIVAYFMHLRFERVNLVLTIVPAVVIGICLLDRYCTRLISTHTLSSYTLSPVDEKH